MLKQAMTFAMSAGINGCYVVAIFFSRHLFLYSMDEMHDKY